MNKNTLNRKENEFPLNPSHDKKWLLQAIKLAFALLLFYWVLKKSDISLQSIRGIFDIELVVVVLSLTITTLLFNNWRWWVLLRARQFDLSYLESLKLTFVGLFFNFAVPGSVGGDFIKGYYLCSHHKQRKVEASFTIIVDRLVGFFVMLNLAILGILLSWEKIKTNLLVINLFSLMLAASILTVGVVAVLFFFHKKSESLLLSNSKQNKILQTVNIFLDAVASYRRNAKALIVAVILSFFGQILSVFIFMYVGYRLDEILPFQAHLFVVALGFIASSIPFSPGGIGLGQLAFYFFYKLYTGENLQVGTLGITIVQLFMFSLGLLGGLLYLRGVKARVEIKQ